MSYSHAAAIMASLNATPAAAPPAEHIRWRDVPHSTNVVSVGWDSDRNMFVHFVNGGIYMYRGVSRQRAVAAARAVSVGRYLNRVIKPYYKAVKIG